MFECFDLIDMDFQEHLGIDLGDGLLRRRSGRWLKSRIEVLLSLPPLPEQHSDGTTTYVHRTRLGRALFDN